MYPNIPINRNAMDVVKVYLEYIIEDINMFGFKIGHVMEIMEFVLNNTYTRYGERFYLPKTKY